MTFVLVVDDEQQIVRTLEINLLARGYEVASARDGTSALAIAKNRTPDVTILDLGLPDIDGVSVLHRLREWTQAPVIVLSARRESDDKVEALDSGADDYVTKPFGMSELLARVRAAVRRGSQPDGLGPIQTETFTIDFDAKTVTRDDAVIRLTPTEWHVVEVLARNSGRLVSQQELLHEVWGPAYDRETNYLRVYLAGIRRKLEADPSRPRHFITEPGMGYRFVP
jgi:two-component system KDP operon response regulator KdpE